MIFSLLYYIYNRESFAYVEDWGGDGVFCNIAFRNSSGAVASGFLIDPADGVLTECIDYPYESSVKINGQTYKTFYMRNAMNVYTAGGTKWGSVAAGQRVACKTGLSGVKNPQWKAIDYVRSTAGSWVPVTGDGVSYGFVDTGLSIASSYSSIRFTEAGNYLFRNSMLLG